MKKKNIESGHSCNITLLKKKFKSALKFATCSDYEKIVIVIHKNLIDECQEMLSSFFIAPEKLEVFLVPTNLLPRDKKTYAISVTIVKKSSSVA